MVNINNLSFISPNKSQAHHHVQQHQQQLHHNFVTSSASVTNLSFKNDDYNYLINNNELIQTCREALLENEGSSAKLSHSPDDFNLHPTLSSPSPSLCSPAISLGSFTRDNSLGESSTGVASSTSSMDKMSIKEFSKWINHTEEHLDSVCYCSFRQGNVNITSYDSKRSSANSTSKNWMDAIAEHKVIQAEIQSVGRRFINSLKSNANKINPSLLAAEETRWQYLWLKALECLMLVEEHHTCPNHTTWNRERTSTPYSNSKRFKLGPFSEGKENIRGMMRNRRIQTNMIGIGGGPGLNETFNVPNGKYEIIHKDIGYSSDADMSDACEPASCPNYINSNAKSPRKRHRRRRPRIGERPWSFHSEWTQWDYYQPPFSGISGEYRSSEDLNSFEDENLVRSLTEFGENYERWFKTDDGLLRGSEDLNSHEEVSSIRSTTESTTGNSENWLQPGDGEDNLSSSLGKPAKFLTSSPNITLSSLSSSSLTTSSAIDPGTGADATFDVITNKLPTTTKAVDSAQATFIIQDTSSRTPTTTSTKSSNNISYDTSTAIFDPHLSPVKDTKNDHYDDYDESGFTVEPSVAMKTAPTKILSTSSTQTLFPSTKSTATSISSLDSTQTSKTSTTTTTSTKYFFIYLTITILIAFILSILVAQLTPITPHVQKSYPNRSPPN